MSAKKRNKTQILDDNKFIHSLKLKGVSFSGITDLLNSSRDYSLSIATVVTTYNKFLDGIIELLSEESKQEVRVQLDRYELIIKESFEQWELSKEDKKFKEETYKSKNESDKLIKQRETVATGDTKYLDSIMKAMDAKAKLLNLYEQKESGDNVVINIIGLRATDEGAKNDIKN